MQRAVQRQRDGENATGSLAAHALLLSFSYHLISRANIDFRNRYAVACTTLPAYREVTLHFRPVRVLPTRSPNFVVLSFAHSYSYPGSRVAAWLAAHCANLLP